MLSDALERSIESGAEGTAVICSGPSPLLTLYRKNGRPRGLYL